MSKKANKTRKKPSAPQQAPADKYKKYARKPETPKKSKKALVIAIAACAAACVIFAALLISGVFAAGRDSIEGRWKSDDGFGITVEGDRLVDSYGDEYRIEYSSDDVFIMYISENASEGAGDYFAEFAYKLEGDTLYFYNTSDAAREYPEMVFTRSQEGDDPEKDASSSSPLSSEQPSSSEQQSEPDDGIPEFEKLGIAEDLMERGVTYPFETEDYASEDGGSVSGTVRVTDYTRGPLTENAKKFAEEMEVDLTGYESRVVTVELFFECPTPDVAYLAADYYHTKLFEDNFNPIGVSDTGTQYATSKIIFNGEEKTVYMLGDAGFYEDESAYKTSDVWEAIVPEGYDGVCFGYYNTQLLDLLPDGVDKAYSYDYYRKGDMLYFRCA